MRVVIASDSFGGTLSASEANDAIAETWAEGRVDDDIVRCPMSDGGPGFIDVLRSSLEGRLIDVQTIDPLGRPVTGRVLMAGRTAYVESADAAGLHLLKPDERDPMRASTYGVGVLLLAAVEAGASSIVVGLGGSATNDCGVGMLAAVGIVARDGTGTALPPGALALLSASAIDGHATLRGVSLIAATDVDSPLTGPHGASAVFGPQKGATPDQVAVLDTALAGFAALLERDLPGTPAGLATIPGAGAAGGLGAALFALGGVRRSGFEVVASAIGLARHIAHADLVITGEGRLDEQSVRGKAPAGVARLAQEHGVPCVAVAGEVRLGRRQLAAYGFEQAYSLREAAGERALTDADAVLRDVARKVARDWSR